MTTTTDQDRTLTFPNVVAKRLAEATLERERDWQRGLRHAATILGLSAKERVGRLLDLGDETYVVETITDARSLWAVILSGDADPNRFYTVDEALLRAVELRNRGDANSRGHIYAARMLGVGTPKEGQ